MKTWLDVLKHSLGLMWMEVSSVDRQEPSRPEVLRPGPGGLTVDRAWPPALLTAGSSVPGPGTGAEHLCPHVISFLNDHELGSLKQLNSKTTESILSQA